LQVLANEGGNRVDERVAMAISHWAPRFTMNGVTAGDFERITSSLERWDDWCAAWSAVAAEHEKLGRDALAAGREMSGGAHLSQAAVYYHFAKFLFVDDLDQMRTAHMAAVSRRGGGSRSRSRARTSSGCCASRGKAGRTRS
jgi:2,6-dihydroxypseudooxynicotine hydrolase